MKRKNWISQQRKHFDAGARQQALSEGPLPDTSPFVNRQNEIFLNFGGFRDFTGQILEVGCGTGEFTLALLRRRFKVTVLDISKESLSLLKKYVTTAHLDRYLEGMVCSSLEDRTKDLNGYFDIVISASFMHHTVDLNRTIQIMRDLLKPGGRLLAREPNGSWPLWPYLPKVIPSFVWEYEKGLLQCTESNWSKLLSEAGFVDIQIEPLTFIPARVVNQFPSFANLTETVLYKVVPRPLKLRLTMGLMIKARKKF